MENNINSGVKYSSIDVSGFAGKFRYICEHIDKFTINSEERFLTLGKKLQAYLNDSRNLTKLAAKAAASISDEILDKGISQLTALLEEFNYYIKITTEVIKSDRNELLNILPDVISIIDHLEGFDKIIKQLRMLGISTKIESARLGAEDQGFFALAETVDKLSGLINEKVKSILEKSNFLISELNKTTANLAKLDKDQNEQSSIIISKITHSMGAFKSKYDKRAVKASELSACSEGVTRNIGEIVTSIQIHDITRQRLEHSKSAFNGIVEKIYSGMKSHQYEDILGEVYDISLLESSQLRNAAEEFKSAVAKIASSLSGVEKNVAKMLSETVELIYENGNSGESSIKSVSDELNVISKELNKNVDVGSQLSSSINSVITIVEDLAKYILEIEDIGTEIELISLNARVKAARTGKNGSALGVLSENVQRLSVDAKSQTGSMSKVLNSISDKSKSLRTNLEKGTYSSDANKLITSNDKISDLIKMLTELETREESDIELLSEQVSNLKEDINRSIKDLGAENITAGLCDIVRNEIELINKQIFEDGNYRSDMETNTKNLMHRYTMDNERRIHQNIVSSKNAVVSSNPRVADTEEDYLGDNVELF